VVHPDEENAGQGDTSRWTLDALRKLVQSQAANSDKNNQQMAPPKSSPSPAVSAVEAGKPGGVAAGSPSAPVLQPSPIGEGLDSTSNISRPWLPWILLGLAVSGLAAIFIFGSRKQ
jgi:hypothetical protein